MRRLPPLQSLLAFESAARLGSFSRAAQELSLTQSAISHQIQQLEDWAGLRLFLRVGRGVALTDAGRLFSRTVNDTLKLLADGRDRIEPYGNPDSVILYCPPQFAHGLLLPQLPALKADYPSLEIWIITQQEVREIDRVDVDLIISEQPLRTSEVVCVSLLADRAIAVCGPRTAETLAARPFPEVLTDAPLLVDEQRPDWAPWLPEYRREGLLTTRALTMDDPQLLLKAAEQEMGIAMVSHLLVKDALAHGRLAALPHIPGFALPELWLMKSALPARAAAVDMVHAWLLELGAAAALQG